MTRVSPPELARELPGPQASTSVTRAPRRSRWSAVQPPNAPAPTTTTCRCLLIGLQPFRKGDAPSAVPAAAQEWRNDRRGQGDRRVSLSEGLESDEQATARGGGRRRGLRRLDRAPPAAAGRPRHAGGRLGAGQLARELR